MNGPSILLVVLGLATGARVWAPESPSFPPSVVLLSEPLEPGSADSILRPQFRRVHGRAAASIAVDGGTSLYGTGEAAGGLLRNGTRSVAFNTDAYGWSTGAPSLYKSHPWVLAVRADGSAYGVLADTPERVLIDLKQDILLVADGPAFRVVTIEGDSPQEVVQVLAALTGTMPLPPLWALGYHQCRYSYTPDTRVLEVARGFRSRDIPADVIWFDIDYMDRRRSFTWNPQTFSDPVGLMDDLHGLGFRSIAILDPGIARAEDDAAYRSGEPLDLWVQRADGKPYIGDVWPGACVFPDFTMERARRWWGDRVGAFVQVGVDGVWNDMNEPAVFNVEGHTMPSTNLHRADSELGGPGDHARYHNLYGREMSRATYEGLRRARPDRRPFVLTRASHLGGQRWAATWSGDNTASWEHLELSIPVVVNLGLSAWPLSGPDIGGFKGNGTAELFARWIGIGSLLPFARGHTEIGSRDKEPWAWGAEVEATSRRALQRRYRLMPYLYTLAYEASMTGLPICRPVFFADPQDPSLREMDDAFLLGDDLLVIARTSPDAHFEVPGFAATWPVIDLGVDDARDPDLPQLRLRPGRVLPLGPVVPHTTDAWWEELELVATAGVDEAVGRLYEDAGEGFGYQAGRYLLSEVRIVGSGRDASSRWASIAGTATVDSRAVAIRWVR